MDYGNENLAEELSEIVCGRKVASISGDTVVLDNGVELKLYDWTEDYCTTAEGVWKAVNGLKAIITKVSFDFENSGDGYGETTTGTITLLHNQNPVVQGECYATGESYGYYFSILHLRVRINGEDIRDLRVINA